MSDQTLSVVNGAINIPGVSFSRNGLSIDASVQLPELLKVLGAIEQMEGGTSWWYGDLALEIQARAATDEALNGDADAKQGEDRENADVRRMNMSVTYTVGHAEQLGISVEHFRHCAMIARFFPAMFREHGLSWKHHAVAMAGAGGAKGDVKKASAWLKRAAEEKWTVAEMRKHVNLALATLRPPEAPAEPNPFSVVDEVDAWLSKHNELPRMTAAQARAQLTRWASLVTFIKGLEQIASAD